MHTLKNAKKLYSHIRGNINVIDTAALVPDVIFKQFKDSVRSYFGPMHWNSNMDYCIGLLQIPPQVLS